jgi:hypothetical protein
LVDAGDTNNAGEASDQREREARLVARYRSRQARLRTSRNGSVETMDEFGERVFGSDAAYEVLIDYLREHTAWTPDDEATADDADAR